MQRFPRWAPYQGPTANYDRVISPQQNLSRLVYGMPKPLLAPGQWRDEEFYGRLLDELANSHAVLVKVCRTRQYAENFSARLRKELPGDLYEVKPKQDADDPREDEWFVIAYNRVTRTLREPSWMRSESVQDVRPSFINVKEMCRILKLNRSQVLRLIDRYQIPYEVRGGRRERWVHRSAVATLMDRPGRWKRRSPRT